MQHFRYWLPSSAARICLASLHPATLIILMFHKQLLQVFLSHHVRADAIV
jgi:hypothetical protein